MKEEIIEPYDFDVNAPPPGFPPLNRPINATPISSPIKASQNLDSSGRHKKPKPNPKPVKEKTEPLARSLNNRDHLSASSSNVSNESKEQTEMILSTFDALRRRLLQIADSAFDANLNKRVDMKAAAIMNANDLKANRVKRVGSVPGVEVGDIFYFRTEMCVVGLHSLVMTGIDYLKENESRGEPIATSIVSSGGYENEEDNIYELVYTGEGGNCKNENKRRDQKLVKGNLAMKMSLERKNEIRVIRGIKDPHCRSSKIYMYDGLYKIQSSWVDTSKKGFRVFKYKLVREPGQPDSIATWYRTQQWISNPSSRPNVLLDDLSCGEEDKPILVVNDTNHETKLNNVTNFKYATENKWNKWNGSEKTVGGCICRTACLPGNTDCSCAKLNGGDLPYSLSGILTTRLKMAHECGENCGCSIYCRNRVTQNGILFHFEVFMTSSRGWGVRSWDPIRAGSFICEFVGEFVENLRSYKEFSLNKYLFCVRSVGEKALKWNRGAELAMEGKIMNVNAGDQGEPKSVPIISGKRMGNFSRFMNHSCDPNVFWQLVKIGDEKVPHVMFFAVKHIPPFTELTYDYGVGTGIQKGSNGTDRAQKCLCGASNCRGRFG